MFVDVSLYDQIEYRLVYLCPNLRSNERVTVGIVSKSIGGFELRLLSSVAALDCMSQIVGYPGVEQFHFSANELRRLVRNLSDWSSLTLPTDLLTLGDTTSAFTSDRHGFLTSVLTSSSMLLRRESTRAHQVLPVTTVTSVSKDLFNEVTLLHPLMAKDLFDQKVPIDSEREVKIPILGNRVFGWPVSLLSATSSQITRAEALVAKLRWLQNYVDEREPKLYALSSERNRTERASRNDSGVEELQEIANASDVSLKVSASISELATCLIRDEAA